LAISASALSGRFSGQRELRMRKPDKAVRQQTARVALGVAALVAVMLAVYAIIGRLSLSVALGGIYSGCLGVANFFIMGMMVQSVTERMAEKERTEQEIADMSIQMQNRMKISYNMRMIGLFGLLVLGIAVFKFDALATILPSVFPSIVIRVLQIMEARKAPVSEGSEEP
jgi:hypothetical protein